MPQGTAINAVLLRVYHFQLAGRKPKKWGRDAKAILGGLGKKRRWPGISVTGKSGSISRFQHKLITSMVSDEVVVWQAVVCSYCGWSREMQDWLVKQIA